MSNKLNTNINKKWPAELLRALDIAESHNEDSSMSKRRFSLAAIGIRNDGVVVKSKNGGGCCKVIDRHPIGSHAEARLSKKLDVGSIVYVARTRKDYSPANAKPCYQCEGIMRAKGISKVFYTTNDGWEVIDLQKKIKN